MRILGLLTLTHSSRRTQLARCSAEFLTRRFADPGRLASLPPFAALPPPEVLYSGAVSFHVVEEGPGGAVRVRPAGIFKSRDKIQHAAFLSPTDVLVGFEQRIERRRLPAPWPGLVEAGAAVDLARAPVVATYAHPHLAGLHTVAPLADGRVAISCSDADAVLFLDPETGRFGPPFRLPAELYGRGYDLAPGHDLCRHGIPDDLQTTHVNAAHPTNGGEAVLVSTLIQGAVGRFDLETGAYAELARGFVGCHGARMNGEGEVYFSDSTRGALVVLDPSGGVARRFAVGSAWLHDAVQIRGPLYAFALADRNELTLWDVDRGQLVFCRKFFTWPLEGGFAAARRLSCWLGNSTQALSWSCL